MLSAPPPEQLAKLQVSVLANKEYNELKVAFISIQEKKEKLEHFAEPVQKTRTMWQAFLVIERVNGDSRHI